MLVWCPSFISLILSVIHSRWFLVDAAATARAVTGIKTSRSRSTKWWTLLTPYDEEVRLVPVEGEGVEEEQVSDKCSLFSPLVRRDPCPSCAVVPGYESSDHTFFSTSTVTGQS